MRHRSGPIQFLALSSAIVAVLLAGATLPPLRATTAAAFSLPAAAQGGAIVSVEKAPDGSFHYLVDGQPQILIGMGYNPIYRDLPPEQRAERYENDFRLLRAAGVNHITGWDADKGYEQDKFDELTLDAAHRYGLGVIMPFYLPPDGNYADSSYCDGLLDEAAMKIARFKDHPAIRMWGLGNEVLNVLDSVEDQAAFLSCYVHIADLFHALDPSHPVIYRESEDRYVPMFREALGLADGGRPWLLYGVNAYTLRLASILADWPSHGLDRPTFVTEFGAEGYYGAARAEGYVAMWQMIRQFPQYVLGGAPYVWTTEGPEPTDVIWGLMDKDGQAIDSTFERLSAEWLASDRQPQVSVIATATQEGTSFRVEVSVSNNSSEAIQGFEIEALLPAQGQLTSVSPSEVQISSESLKWYHSDLAPGEIKRGFAYEMAAPNGTTRANLRYWGALSGSAVSATIPLRAGAP